MLALVFQGQELTIRQIALLGFRDLVLLKVYLDKTLPLMQSPIPPPILQMLLVLQVGVERLWRDVMVWFSIYIYILHVHAQDCKAGIANHISKYTDDYLQIGSIIIYKY